MSDYRKIETEIERLLLPEGRLDPEEVERSQRRRLQLALALESWRSGYEVVSVDGVADTAMLSKTTLYALFVSKRGLLETAVGDFSQAAGRSIQAAFNSRSSWTETVAAGLEALTESVVAEPALARLTFVEAPAILADAGSLGPAGETAEARLLSGVFTGAARAADAPAEELDELTRPATLSGMAAPIADRLMRGRSAEVRDLAPSLLYLAVNAHLGPETALEALETIHKLSRTSGGGGRRAVRRPRSAK